jgi:trehalose/maltose hydrolase-like predicted phosphorylase
MILEQLGRRFEGVVLVGDAVGAVAADTLAALDHDGVTVAIAAERPLAEALGELWRLGVAPGNVLVVADPAELRLLDDQRRRRQERDVPSPVVEPDWALVLDGLDPERERVAEAWFTLADGRIGTSGAPLAGSVDTRRWVLTGGVYVGDGPPTHLVTAPVAFHLPRPLGAGDRLRRVLDFRTGVLYEEVDGSGGSLRSARFSSLARPGTVVVRAWASEPLGPGPLLLPPVDHPVVDEGADDGVEWMQVAAGPGGVTAAAKEERGELPGGAVLDRFVTYLPDASAVPPTGPAVAEVRRAASDGFDRLLAEHRRAWAARWNSADIVVEGDADAQLAVRFALFHLIGSVPDTGEAAVGARGLTGMSYRGHVFWDADTFVLPFLAATHPAAARAMLEYRVQRLPAALEAARAIGRAGARFPWESAGSGRDVTPLSARDRTGRLIPIRTGQLEEHIVAQVAWAVNCYVEWTGDEDFARGPGLQLLVETARYWVSRLRVEPNGSAHIYGVIGPDEYHEPVDDNACTNVMAGWNLRRAAEAVEAAGFGPVGVDVAETRRWRELADAVVDGWDPETGLYEQFAGFRRLEPLLIGEVAPRRPIPADVVLGFERVRGAQVLKQADVLMLHHLIPDEVRPGTLEPNLRFYEPRTAHGSSLSPSIHASLFARAGEFDKALEALHIASRMDLDDLTGSTAGGLHLATMGGLWQAFAFGFGGVRPRLGRLLVNPRLPPSWSALELRVRFRGVPVRVRVDHTALTIDAEGTTGVLVDGAAYTAGPRTLSFARTGPRWEPTG